MTMEVRGSKASRSKIAPEIFGRRFFTRIEANSTLPLVSRITRDLVKQYQTFNGLHTRLQDAMLNDKPSDDIPVLESQREIAMQRLNGYVNELTELGCELKDWEIGLVDFPALLDGREVCLCWKSGEEGIEFWHETSTGFPGRQPIKPDDHL